MNDLTAYFSHLQNISRMNNEITSQIGLLGGKMNDRVQISFGGAHYDVLREEVVKDSSIGWNLLSCLLTKKWEKFLLQEKNGRIFFDYEAEWIKPLLSAIRGRTMPLAAISCKPATQKLCCDFHIKEKHVFGGVPVIDDLPYSFAHLPAELSSLREEIVQVLGTNDYYGTRLFSTDFHPRAMWMTWETVPHTVTCILLQLTSGVIYSAFIEKDFDFSSRKDSSILVRLLRPVKQIKGPGGVAANMIPFANLRIGPEGTIELSTDLRKDQWHALMKVYKIEVYSLQELYTNSFGGRSDVPEEKSDFSLKHVEDCLYQSYVKLDFMQSYIYELWKDLIPEFPSPTIGETSSLNEKSIESYLTYFETVLPLITQFKETLKSASSEERRLLDPLASFNVEGSLFVTRKSTLLEVFPESQLAVRVSGRWTEQEQDIDEDGNIYYNVQPGSFQLIIQYARQKMLLGSSASAEMIVKKELEGEVKELLGYLTIDTSKIYFKYR